MDFQHPQFMQIYGAPGSGKTYLIKYILYMMLKTGIIEWVNVFTGTSHDNEWDFLPGDCVVCETPSFRKKVGAEDKKAIPNIFEWYLEKKLIPFGETTRKPGLLLMDDLTGSCNFKKDAWSQLFTNFRHYCKLNPADKEGKFSILLSSHYVFRIPPVVREAGFQVAIFSLLSKNAIKAVHETYAQITGDDYKSWNEYQQKCTDRVKHIFILFKRAPKPGQKYFQPCVCPVLPAEVFQPRKVETEKPIVRKRKIQTK
jgi:hypothetical protein